MTFMASDLSNEEVQSITEKDADFREGRDHFKKGIFDRAAECFAKVLIKLQKMNVKEFSYDYAEVHRNLAHSYMIQGFFGQAEPHFNKSLEIAEYFAQRFPSLKSSALLTRSVGAVAAFLLNQNLLQDAEPYCIRCLFLAEKTFGMDHYKLLEPIRAMAFLCEKQGKLEEAIRHLKRAYVVVLSSRGPLHIEAQRVIDDLLRLLHSIGDLRSAEAYATMNLDNLREFLPESDPSTLPHRYPTPISHHNTGYHTGIGIGIGIDSTEVAEDPHYDPYCATTPSSTSTSMSAATTLPIAEALCKLAKLHLEADQPVKAERHLREALVIQEIVLGPVHPDVGETIYMLATALFKQEMLDSATEDLYNKALKIFETVYGNESPQVAGLLRDIGVLHMCRGNADMAEDFISLCAGMQRRMLGSSHEQLAATLDIQATIFYNQKRFLEAQMLWMKAEVILVNRFGPGHPRCLQIQEDLRDVRQYLS